MRVRPVLNDDSLRRPARVAVPRPKLVANLIERVGHRLWHEFRQVLPPTIFFFVGFNFIVFTTNLLVADYAIAVSSFMLATLAALVVGKAVLVANAMPFLRRYDRAPLITPILFKTAVYWVIVFIARLLERFVHFSVLERKPPSDFIPFLITTFLVAPVLGDLAVDPGPVPDLCNGDRIQPPLRSGRDAAAFLYLPPIRAAAEPPPALSRIIAPQPSRRYSYGRGISRSTQRRTQRTDPHPRTAREIARAREHPAGNRWPANVQSARPGRTKAGLGNSPIVPRARISAAAAPISAKIPAAIKAELKLLVHSTR